MRDAVERKLLLDGMVTHTGDDIALVMSHTRGVGAPDVHRFAWDTFLAATEEARTAGLYGAGQDLLVDAPSGNVRGAGPAVAEIEFERDPRSKDRPAEPFLLFAGDKCSPGAYSYPLYSVFCDPMHNGGLLLSPKIHKGFTLTIIDMDHAGAGGDRVIRLDVPERVWDVACLLQNPDRFAIEAIHSRHKPDEQVVSVSATRLHNIAGTYTGKDDPVAIVRTQGIFPAPEEVMEPYILGHFVTGDTRGSHVMPIMPVPINTAVSGPYCLPIVSCVACSMDAAGRFTDEWLDIFGNVAWDATREGPAEGRRVAAAGVHRPDDGVACRARLHRHHGHLEGAGAGVHVAARGALSRGEAPVSRDAAWAQSSEGGLRMTTRWFGRACTA